MHVVRVTLAVDDLERMVAFYNEAFECRLSRRAESPIFVGKFAGFEFQLCPNSVAGVVADQNRHQFRVGVEDLEGIAASVISAGGSIVNRSGDGAHEVIGISDPEGNTLELVVE